MDSLERVRELRHPIDSDLRAARSALASEMAGAVRRRRRSGVATRVLTGSLVVGAIVAGTLTGFMQPDAVPGATAATEVLNRAAVNVGVYDFPVAPGQYLATTVTNESLMYVTVGEGGNPEPSPFAEGAIAAVNETWTNTVYRAGDPSVPLRVATGPGAGTTVYGDRDAVAAADVFPQDVEGDTIPGVAVWDVLPDEFPEFAEEGDWLHAVSPSGDYPRDPAAFLAAWEDAIPAEHADSGMNATEVMLNSIPDTMFSSIVDASGEYRATFFRALALSDDVTVVSTDDALSVLEADTPNAFFRLTLDTAKGLVHRLERFDKRVYAPDGEGGALVPVDTTSVVPEGTPSAVMTVTQQVVDEVPEVTDLP